MYPNSVSKITIERDNGTIHSFDFSGVNTVEDLINAIINSEAAHNIDRFSLVIYESENLRIGVEPVHDLVIGNLTNIGEKHNWNISTNAINKSRKIGTIVKFSTVFGADGEIILFINAFYDIEKKGE